MSKNINCLVDHKGAPCTCDLSMYENINKPMTKNTNTHTDWEKRFEQFVAENKYTTVVDPALLKEYDVKAFMAKELADARREVEDMAETEMLQIIDERDNAEMWADNLARRLAPPEILGEHSNVNNPWKNAMEYVRPVESLKPIIDVLATLREEESK